MPKVGQYVLAMELTGCMFPGSLCHTWIETDGSNLFVVGLRTSYLVLINTLCGIADGAEPLTIYIVGVSYVLTSSQDGQLSL